MKSIEATCDIQATPEQIWEALTDFGAYFQWNPLIVKAKGEATLGAALELTYRNFGSAEVTVRPRITALRAPHDLRWAGRTFLPGLMDGEHSIVIEAFDGGLCCVAQRKVVDSIMERHMTVEAEAQARQQLEAMNDALKRRVESEAARTVAAT
jgi:hypothetical protein